MIQCSVEAIRYNQDRVAAEREQLKKLQKEAKIEREKVKLQNVDKKLKKHDYIFYNIINGI